MEEEIPTVESKYKAREELEGKIKRGEAKERSASTKVENERKHEKDLGNKKDIGQKNHGDAENTGPGIKGEGRENTDKNTIDG